MGKNFIPIFSKHCQFITIIRFSKLTTCCGCDITAAGVCSYYGWGTEEDMEISIQCILKSAKLNCSYAKVFISAIYMQGLPQIADQQQAKEFLNTVSS
mgnify:CR=1 FL=1